ncbi:MAG: xylulokinase [Chloroflexota bacterium]
MPQKNFILAHDLGTTGNKATLFDLNGAVVASVFAGYSTTYPQPNWAEQDPADWQRAVLGATQRLLNESKIPPKQIAVVSFSGHMQGALAVDRAGVPLRPAIIWADQRATDQAEFIAQTCGLAEVYQLTGNRVSPAYTAAKVLWIKDRQPDLYQRIYKILQPKDYAAFLLSGVFATDYSDASLTQLLDLKNRVWAGQLLASLGIAPELLPDLFPSAAVIGQVTPQAAVASGLSAGTPVVIGGGDGACATVGAGSVRAGDVYNYIGSSSWVALSSDQPVLDPQQRTFNFVHLNPELYCAIGTMQAAGGAYDWLERLFRDEAQAGPLHQFLDEAAGTVPPGSSGLLFLPYLLGERSPHWNPLARGAFIGLAMPDQRGELARAVLEGVAFNLRHILDILRGQGIKIEAMRLIGGGSQSAIWRQILADVYNLPLLRPGLPAEATALGAAIAGGIGVGLYPDYSVVRDLIPVSAAEKPNPATRSRYEALYQLFKESYIALEPIYERLATLPK